MNARQERFVQEFLVDPNATRAARRAGYSNKTADRIGSRLLRNVEVAAAVKQGQDARAERTQVTADMVVRELGFIAFGVMGDFFDQNTGRLLDITELPHEAQARLASIEVVRERTHRVSTDVDKTSVRESTVKIKGSR